jgi:membrane protein implicated in regulation of membrane protease activity
VSRSFPSGEDCERPDIPETGPGPGLGTPLRAVATAVAFLLELAALAALGYWGASAGHGAWAYVLAAITPLVAAVFWGTFASPRASVRLATVPKVAVRLRVLLGGAVALAVAGQGWRAIALATVIVGDEVALIALGEPVAGAG